MNNYKILIQYDGSGYAGWQIQKNKISVQQKITEAINILTGESVNLIGSGRTDSGVHALGQTANFKAGEDIDIYRFKHSLNSMLPFDISILSMEKAEDNFHARYDARKRSYIYLMSQFKSPFYRNYSYFYPQQVDIERLNILSKEITGKYNFSSFCKKKSETENKICEIYNARWRKSKSLIVFFIEADRFLHGMVRTITGTLLNAMKESYDENYIRDILKAEDREAAGEAVPAKGLFLYKVKYKK